MVDVPNVVFDTLGHAVDGLRFAAVAVDLRPTGDTRLDVVTERVVGDDVLVLGVVGNRMWPGADQRHLSPEHVEQLREFVDAGLP